MALVRLNGGDPQARSDLFAARDAGLRLRLDELVTVPMSNLAHHDVEQGRFAQADDILADALRFSEERDIPICSMWQRGVQARLRLLQGRWREAEQDALAVLAAGDIPLGRLWSHLVLGLLAARREAPAENPHLDELWRLATRLDLARRARPGRGGARRAGVDHPSARSPARRALVAVLVDLPGPSGDQLRRWLRRLAAAGVQHVDAPRSRRGPPAFEQQPYERALALWDGGSADDLLAALPLLDELDARAVAALVRGRLRELGVTGCRAAAHRPPGPTPAGSPTASSTCWPCSSRA